MRSSYRLGLALSVVLLPSSAAVAAAQAGGASFEFSIKNMMRGPEVYGREPENVRWSADSRWIYFNWLEPGSDWHLPSKPLRVRAEAGAKPGAKPEHVTEAQMDSVAPLLDQGRQRPAAAHEGEVGGERRIAVPRRKELLPQGERAVAR